MNVTDTIKDILVTDVFVEVPVERMRDDESLRDVYGLDSLGFVELRAQCESRFSLTIPADDFTPEHFHTIADVAALVERLKNSSAAR
ncbi:acyl carrier protein [Streptomyces sp. SID486]|uniref:acyl carrier protein n=1 Tax=unclassified Streptomyces TaxID=2593676 RepID=UPI001371032C|nr:MULTISPECIES: acyl carrier protein [unclassified Streptomyces]MYW16499.1 acyl carrier protein [Streptomyces sp. SID2955]MYW46138.1 acyl carrier protein [Streptomyces sp. SID161]MYX96612.1 acyl carrier protein [Streptomyces sp. SID486]